MRTMCYVTFINDISKIIISKVFMSIVIVSIVRNGVELGDKTILIMTRIVLLQHNQEQKLYCVHIDRDFQTQRLSKNLKKCGRWS
jgi:hypothetical protein